MIHALLSVIPPEAAHRAAIAALSRGYGPAGPSAGRPTRLFGKDLPGRVGLSGGADKMASALDGWRRLGFAFVEAGTVTPDPRPGNPGKRVWRVGGDAMVNWMGLPGPGIGTFRGNLAAFRATPLGRGYCVGASVHAPTGGPDAVAAMGIALAPLVDFMTMNASCPNTEHGKGALAGLVAEAGALVRSAPGVPVLVKLGPAVDMGVVDEAVDAFRGAGVAGFVACNTVPHDLRGMLGPDAPNPWPTSLGKPVGGYSGPGLLGISVPMVERIRARAGDGHTVLGAGGVRDAAGLAAMLSAGADAVQVYTAVARGGPRVLADLVRADAGTP